MSLLRGFIKNLQITVIVYVIAGVAYWTTAQILMRYTGKEIVFSPIISIFLVVTGWPMMVYADLRWIGIMPQDIAAVCAIPVSILFLKIKAS